MSGTVNLDREEFRELAATHRVIPITRRLLADSETPVGVYGKLTGGQPRSNGTFLLESAEHGVWSRYSFIGVRCPAVLTERDGHTLWLGDAPFTDSPDDPLQAVRDTIERLRTPRFDDLPPLTGGLVGYVAYDAVRRLERLPELAENDLRLPELAMLFPVDLAVLDHSEGSILLVANTFPTGSDDADEHYDDAVNRLDAMHKRLTEPTPATVTTLQFPEPRYVSHTPAGIGDGVKRAVEEIRAGEAFQIVVSQRFEMQTDAEPLDVYRVLRTTNPSPYMYLLRFPDGTDVVGSSPEALVKVTGGRALLHPIAGTRWRGDTPAEDARLATELLNDPKERAEHVMLVDLGRNDLGRTCKPGSVEVVDFMDIERYSHVMHLVSTVVGELAEGKNAFDAFTACFPAGTLSGAPKPRAMEIIEELEPVRRGLYGGTVGYLDFAGDLDMAIAIRTTLMREGNAYVQAGGGIVADSDPAAEEQESQNKARAVLRAIAAAETLRQ